MPVNCSAPRNQASAVKVQVANPRNTCYTMPCHVLRAPVFFHHEMLCNCVTDRINAWWFRHLWWCIPWRCRRVFCSASKSNLGSASFPQNFARAKPNVVVLHTKNHTKLTTHMSFRNTPSWRTLLLEASRHLEKRHPATWIWKKWSTCSTKVSKTCGRIELQISVNDGHIFQAWARMQKKNSQTHQKTKRNTEVSSFFKRRISTFASGWAKNLSEIPWILRTGLSSLQGGTVDGNQKSQGQPPFGWCEKNPT